MVLRISSLSKGIAGLLVLTVFVGCASIVGKSSPEPLNVRSVPDQARVVINDETGTKIFEGMTPTILSLEKKKGYFSGKKYNVTLSKDGFKDQNVVVDTEVGGWYIGGNLVFGGLIGWLIVDPATGAMWTLNTNEINAKLESAPTATAPALQSTMPSAGPESPSSPAAVEPVQQVTMPSPAPEAQTPAPTQSQMTQPDSTVIAPTADAPESMRAKMVPVSQ